MWSGRGTSIKNKIKLLKLSLRFSEMSKYLIWYKGLVPWHCCCNLWGFIGLFFTWYSCPCHQKQYELVFVVSDDSQSWAPWSLHRPWYRRTFLPSFQLLLWQLVHTGVGEFYFLRAGAGLAWNSYRQECLAVGLGLLSGAGGHFEISVVTYSHSLFSRKGVKTPGLDLFLTSLLWFLFFNWSYMRWSW